MTGSLQVREWGAIQTPVYLTARCRWAGSTTAPSRAAVAAISAWASTTS